MFPLSSKRLAFHQILWQVISSDADLHSSPGAVNKPVSALNADATPRRPRKAPQIHKAPRRRVPLGFFDNVPRPIGAILCITQSTHFLSRLPTFSHRHRFKPHTISWSQHTLLGCLPTFFRRRRSELRTATKRDAQRRSRLPRNIVSRIHRRFQLQAPPSRCSMHSGQA